MSSYLKIIIVVAAFGIPVPFIACGSVSGPGAAIRPLNSTPAAAPTATPSDALAASRDLYKTNCAKCHQDSGKGGKTVVDGKNINPKDLTGDKMKKRDDEKLFDDIAEGSPDDGMPAFKGKLSDAQINEVIRYIRAELQK
jgi:mono/diheme cytochrome c family protein